MGVGWCTIDTKHPKNAPICTGGRRENLIGLVDRHNYLGATPGELSFSMEGAGFVLGIPSKDMGLYLAIYLVIQIVNIVTQARTEYHDIVVGPRVNIFMDTHDLKLYKVHPRPLFIS